MDKLAITALAAGILGLAASQAVAAPSSTDQTFATKAAQGGIAEVQIGALAQQNATSPQVQQFGKMLVDDHSKANQELQRIAQQEGISLPTQPGRKEARQSQKLQNLSGKAFDKRFVRDEVADHKKDIAEFQKEAQSGSDPALKSFAQSALPVLQKHLQTAESLTNQR
jgi:putative membrane protein